MGSLWLDILKNGLEVWSSAMNSCCWISQQFMHKFSEINWIESPGSDCWNYLLSMNGVSPPVILIAAFVFWRKKRTFLITFSIPFLVQYCLIIARFMYAFTKFCNMMVLRHRQVDISSKTPKLTTQPLHYIFAHFLEWAEVTYTSFQDEGGHLNFFWLP